LDRRGFRVAGLDLDEIATGCEFTARVDISDEAAVSEAVTRVSRSFDGRLDAVVNAAGAVFDATTPVGDIDAAMLRRTVEVNLLGAVFVTKASLGLLVAARGSLVLVASCVARAPQVGASAYAMAKAGVVSLARSVALEYGAFGVRANSVSPGYMDTPMAAPVLGVPHRRARIESSIPTGRVVDPHEVAETIGWLVDAGTPALTGEDILVDAALGLTAYSSADDARRLWASRGTAPDPTGTGTTEPSQS
jgi:NAD(P)-dependent dehydrogenase (short-subunit alcohol dehydrogenase family)